MKTVITILLSTIVINCTLQVPIEEPDKQIEKEIIMNDFIVKPITEYPAYYVQGNAVSGIPADAKGQADLIRITPEIEIDEEVIIYHFDEFFVKDGKVYFKLSMIFPVDMEGTEQETITKYCTLVKGKIVYLTESEFPAIPEPERVTGATGEYNIDIGDYKGDPISVASRTKLEEEIIVPDYAEKFVMIDGFIEIEGGLLIHTPTGRGSSRPAGLLFWPEGKRTMNHWKEVGRFWK